MIDTTWRCGGASGPPTWSFSSSAPSRSAVSGVFSSCERWRRKRFFSASSSASRRRSQSSRSPSDCRSSGPRTVIAAREVRAAKLPDRGVELRDRPRDVARERERDGQHHRGAEDHQKNELTLHRFSVVAQSQHLAVGDKVADGEHFLRVFGELRSEPPDAARIALAPGQRAQVLVETLLLRSTVFLSATSCCSSSGRASTRPRPA